MGISLADLRPTITIIYNKELYTVVSCEHAKLGRGAAFCRAKLRNLKTSQIIETTLRDSDNVEQAFIDKCKLQFLYAENTHYHFLDMQTYEDLVLNKSQIKDKIVWLKDNLELIGLFYGGRIVGLELPLSLKLKVKETDPGFRGNTVKSGTKSARLETGLTVN